MDVDAQTQQQVLVKIDTLIELIEQMEHVSEADEDTSYEANSVMVMQAMDRLHQLLAIPTAVFGPAAIPGRAAAAIPVILVLLRGLAGVLPERAELPRRLAAPGAAVVARPGASIAPGSAARCPRRRQR